MTFVLWAFVKVYLLFVLVGGFIAAIVGIGYLFDSWFGDPWGVVAGVPAFLVAMPLMVLSVGLVDRLPEGKA